MLKSDHRGLVITQIDRNLGQPQDQRFDLYLYGTPMHLCYKGRHAVPGSYIETCTKQSLKSLLGPECLNGVLI